MTKTCKTCRWWSNGECDFIGTVQASRGTTRIEIEVTVADDTGLDYKLVTGPDFGCVHHIPLNKEPAVRTNNDREKFILRAALIYVQSNLADVNEAFGNEQGQISVNGDPGNEITDEEVEQLLFALQ